MRPFREDKLLVGTTFLLEEKVKVYLEDCERQRALCLWQWKRRGVGWVSFLCWSLTALPFGLGGHKWSVFQSGWIRVFHTRWVMSGHYWFLLRQLIPSFVDAWKVSVFGERVKRFQVLNGHVCLESALIGDFFAFNDAKQNYEGDERFGN